LAAWRNISTRTGFPSTVRSSFGPRPHGSSVRWAACATSAESDRMCLTYVSQSMAWRVPADQVSSPVADDPDQKRSTTQVARRARFATSDLRLATYDLRLASNMVKTRRTSAIPRRRGRTNPRSPGPGGPSWSRHLPRGRTATPSLLRPLALGHLRGPIRTFTQAGPPPLSVTGLCHTTALLATTEE